MGALFCVIKKSLALSDVFSVFTKVFFSSCGDLE